MSQTSQIPRRMIIGAILVGILVFAVGARVKPAAPSVFRTGDEVRLLGTDAYFHLRAARYATEQFPHLQRWDVGTSYPKGEYARTPGLYDLTVAGAALIVGGTPVSDTTLLSVAAWSAPVIGALAILALFLLLRRVTDAETGLLACLFVSLYPGSFVLRTALGFGDHHGAEVLLFLLSAWGAAACLGDTPSSGFRAVRQGLVRSLPMALLLFTWAGAPLVLLVMGLGLFLVVTLAVARGQGQAGDGSALLGYGLGVFGWVLLGSLAWPDLVMQPDLWPALLVSCALLGPCFWAYLEIGRRLTGRGVPAPAIALGAIALLAAALVAFVLIVPGADRWLSRIVDTRTELISELAGEITAAGFWRTLGVSGALAVTAPVICLWTAWNDEAERPALLVSLLAGMFLALWWWTHDYDYLVPVTSAAAAALSLRGLWIATLPPQVRTRNAVYAGAFLVALLPIWPSGKLPLPWPTNAAIEKLVLLNDGWVEAMAWMAAATPEPTLSVRARVEPFGEDFHYPAGTYAVLAAWNYGNFVSALAERSVIVSQGISEPQARWMMLTDEVDSIAFWDNHMGDGERIRYIVLDAETLGDHFVSYIQAAGQSPADFIEQPETGQPPVYGGPYRDSIAARLYIAAGDGLSHHRLVYQTAHESVLFYRAQPGDPHAGEGDHVSLLRRSEALGSPEERSYFEDLQEQGMVRSSDGYIYGAEFFPTVRVLEVVPGAVIEGAAAPGARLEARLTLESRSDGETLEYRQSATASADGQFRLTLPYATDGVAASAVSPTGPYRLYTIGDDAPHLLLELDVAETEVQSGALRRLEPL